MSLTEQIVREARLLIGVPYRHLGRNVFGLDCLGLALAVDKAAGVIPLEFDFTDYTQNVTDYELQEHLEASELLERLSSWRDAEPGDVLLQRFHSSLPASHLILISMRQGDALWGVHASNRSEKVVEQRICHLERNVAAFRLKGVVR